MVKKSILIILNTYYHVETTIGIYYSLLKNGYQPYLYVAQSKMFFGFYDYMRELHIPCITDYNSEFDRYIVVTYYPNLGYEINDSNPIFRKLTEDNTIYIAHRCMNIHRHKVVLGVRPEIQKNGIDFLYLCNHKHEDDIDLDIKSGEGVNLLVQGKLVAFNRNLSVPKNMNESGENNIRFIIIGEPGDAASIPDSPFIHFYSGLSEHEFYRICSAAHFVVPLIDQFTGQGTYMNERFTTSLSIAWMFNKPLLLHESLQQVYNCPGLVYSDQTGFERMMENIQNMRSDEYRALVQGQIKFKGCMESHNKNVWEKYI